MRQMDSDMKLFLVGVVAGGAIGALMFLFSFGLAGLIGGSMLAGYLASRGVRKRGIVAGALVGMIYGIAGIVALNQIAVPRVYAIANATAAQKSGAVQFIEVAGVISMFIFIIVGLIFGFIGQWISKRMAAGKNQPAQPAT